MRPAFPRPPRGWAVVLVGLITVALAAPAEGSRIADKRAEIAKLGRELQRLDAAAGEAAAAHNRAIDRLDVVRGQLRRTMADLRRARANHRIAQGRLAARLVAVYKRDTPDLGAVLLRAGSLSDVLAARELLGRIAKADAGIVREVRARRAALAELTARLLHQRTLAQGEERWAAARRVELIGFVRRRREVLGAARADLKRLIAEERARLARLAAEKLAREAAAIGGAPYRASAEAVSLPAGSSHIFPIRGPTRFSDDWLVGRPGGRYHEGIDLFAARGTPVVAVGDGTLSRVGWNGLGGWRLWLRDGAGTEFYYAHLDAFAPAAREGASVRAGTVVGFVGDSGDAKGTSPHVHFEIHPGGGGPIRPYPIVSGWPRA